LGFGTFTDTNKTVRYFLNLKKKFFCSNITLKKFLYIKLLFSDNDVALVMQYRFLEDTSPSSKPAKKRKLDDPITNNILNYSRIKLPVTQFIKYLNENSLEFMNECLK
jgi:hypothetical protein